jgi:hypothetical protein
MSDCAFTVRAMGESMFCKKCGRDRLIGRFRRRGVVEGADRDLWCRPCERLHWDEYVGTVTMMRSLPAEKQAD